MAPQFSKLTIQLGPGRFCFEEPAIHNHSPPSASPSLQTIVPNPKRASLHGTAAVLAICLPGPATPFSFLAVFFCPFPFVQQQREERSPDSRASRPRPFLRRRSFQQPFSYWRNKDHLLMQRRTVRSEKEWHLFRCTRGGRSMQERGDNKVEET